MSKYVPMQVRGGFPRHPRSWPGICRSSDLFMAGWNCCAVRSDRLLDIRIKKGRNVDKLVPPSTSRCLRLVARSCCFLGYLQEDVAGTCSGGNGHVAP